MKSFGPLSFSCFILLLSALRFLYVCLQVKEGGRASGRKEREMGGRGGGDFAKFFSPLPKDFCLFLPPPLASLPHVSTFEETRVCVTCPRGKLMHATCCCCSRKTEIERSKK